MRERAHAHWLAKLAKLSARKSTEIEPGEQPFGFLFARGVFGSLYASDKSLDELREFGSLSN